MLGNRLRRGDVVERTPGRELLKMLAYGCVCSGIRAATVAWKPLGWKSAWFSEILPFRSAVLAHHYPETPNLGNMTKATITVGTNTHLFFVGVLTRPPQNPAK